MSLPSLIENEEQCDRLLIEPNAADVDALRKLRGNVVIVGAGGKMGPTLARRIRRAAELAGSPTEVMAVSRFTDPGARAELEKDGVRTIPCDLLDPDEVAKLPDCENVLFLVGRKFGSTERVDLTWATNALVPASVARRYRSSRIVAFSSGNIYPFVPAESGGCTEAQTPGPLGEYAQSCLARERVFEYYSQEFGTPVLIYRLNYATDLRYGVLTDVARQVMAGTPVNVDVPVFNVLWQGDANSYALRAFELCSSPPRILNVTGPETVSVRRAAQFFGEWFGKSVTFTGESGSKGLLNDASECHSLLGYPEVPLKQLMRWVAGWVEGGGRLLNKPTKFQVTDGKF